MNFRIRMNFVVFISPRLSIVNCDSFRWFSKVFRLNVLSNDVKSLNFDDFRECTSFVVSISPKLFDRF
jgi:hypothetical protein